MDNQTQLVTAMQTLAEALEHRAPAAATTKLISETATSLAQCNGVAFTGTFQQFLNQVPVTKFSDGLSFTPEEHRLWQQVEACTQLGNNLWAARV